MPFFYREIDGADVDPLIRARARDVLEYCRKALGLAAVEIQWVWPASKEDYGFAQALMTVERAVAGLARDYREIKSVFCREEKEFSGQHTLWGSFGNKVQVRADIPLREVLMTVAHELHHYHYSQIYRPPRTAEESTAWERDAETFAKKTISFFEKSDQVSP